MAKKTITYEENRMRQAWTYTIILTLVVGFFFLRPFISIIMLSALMAFFTNPIYNWLVKKFKGKTGRAAAMTTLVLFLIIAVPLFIIFAIAVAQSIALVNDLGLGQLVENNTNLEGEITEAVNIVNDWISSLTGVREAISTDGVTNFLKSTLPDAIKAITDSIIAIASGIPAFFMNLIIFLFVYIGILTNSKRIIEVLHYLSPFEKNVNDRYLTRIGIMAKAMLKGQFFIAFLQGLATSIGLAIVGLEEFFFFFLIIFTFLSLIPLGAGIITIPLGIIALLTGNVWQGLVILGNHFIVVTNIDNIRPKLVPKEARMQSALTILAAFSGVAIFGLLGVIYGPIIMIVLVTTIETYIEVQKRNEKAA